MTGLAVALGVEALKARRALLVRLTMLGYLLLPLVGGLFMVILKDLDRARRFGLISAKAQLTAGTADWATYFGLLTQATAVGGALLFGLLTIWVFGREYSDRTAKDLLALPVARELIVGAKFLVAGGWSAALLPLSYAVALGLGGLIGLPGWSGELALRAARDLAVTGGLTILLVTPFAWAASAGRGYLSGIGALFLAFALAQILVVIGWGAAFPWSVPALFGGAAGPDAANLGASSFLLVLLTGATGIIGTAAWWRWADQG